MPVKSPAATPTKTRKTRTRKTSTKPVVKVTKVKPVQNSKIRTLKSVKRPSTARLISPQKYLKDIQTRWAIHNYEITMLISDLTKGFKAVQPYHAQAVKTVKAWTV
jgi:hypothetical protein